MVATDGAGIPLATLIDSASASEYNLIFPTLDTISIEKRPQHPIKRTKTLIADRGYDAAWVRDELRARGITPYIPKRRRRGQTDEPKYNQKIKPFYATRFIVERTISWLGNFRRILIRWEKYTSTYLGFLHLACIMICLRRF
jgi:transposase